MKPGSCGMPLFGIEFVVVDPVVRPISLYAVYTRMDVCTYCLSATMGNR